MSLEYKTVYDTVSDTGSNSLQYGLRYSLIVQHQSGFIQMKVSLRRKHQTLVSSVMFSGAFTLLIWFSMFRLDFDYLTDLPVLILDVEDDFKNDRIKQEAIIDKVCFYLTFFSYCTLLCFSSAHEFKLYYLIWSLFPSTGQRVSHHAVESSTNYSLGCKQQAHLIGRATL